MKVINVLFLSGALVVSFSLCNGANEGQNVQKDAFVPADLSIFHEFQQRQFLANYINPSETEEKYIRMLGTALRAAGYSYAATNFEKIAGKNKEGGRYKAVASFAGMAPIIEHGFASIGNKDSRLFMAGLPGAVLNGAYHWLFLGDKKLLKRTIDAFAKTPECFSEQAKQILQEAQKNFNTMTKEQIKETCENLRAITRLLGQQSKKDIKIINS